MAAEVELPADATVIGRPDWVDEVDEDTGVLPERAYGWEITTLDDAEWAMGMLASIEQHASAVKDQANKWRAPFDMWEADELRKIGDRHALFVERLKSWGLRQRAIAEAEQGKRAPKKFALPSGRVETTAFSKPQLVVEDEAAVIAWAADVLPQDEYGEVVKVTETVLVSKLAKHIKIVEREPSREGLPVEWSAVHEPTGTVVPGVHVDAPKDPTATVKVER